MRKRLSCCAAAAAFLLLLPLAAHAQTDTALKFSTSVPLAATELKAGLADWENFSVESAVSHFEAAVNADAGFGLARVMYAGLTPKLTTEQRLVEMNRGVADAARASTNELLLAAAYREQFLGRGAAAAALFRAAATLMPGDRLLSFGAVVSGFPTATQVPAIQGFIASHPNYAPPYNNLAYALWAAGDRAGGLAAAKRQIELNPNAPNPHDTYAELLQWNGNFAEASAAYLRAAALTPRFPEAYAGLAEVEAVQGRYDQARAYLNQAIANAWTPQQKLNYMREIAGAYALQGNSDAGLARQYEAIIREATAQGNLSLAAIVYAQLAAFHGNAGKAAESHRALAIAKAAGAEIPWQVHYYGTIAHGLMKHFGPATEELNALKARRATNQGLTTITAVAEGFLLTQQGKPTEALVVLNAADTANVLVMDRIAGAHAALRHQPVAANWNSRINQNYALNLLDIPSAHARRRARSSR